MKFCNSHLCLYVLGLVAMVGFVAHSDIQSQFEAYLDGDVVIGLLASVHYYVKDLQYRSSPEAYTCTDFDLIPFVASLAAIHTIEEINNSNFLPGIKLGYLMCDSCAYATKALECVEHILAVNGSPAVLSNYVNFIPPIKAIIGERYSELSIPVAKLLGLYMIPQISCSASAPVLSDKLRFQSFFRVVPSDVYQSKALTKLMSYYSWNWVGVVYLDDDYGRGVFEYFVQDAQQEHVCLQFKEVLPNYIGIKNMEDKLKNVADRIESSNATVVLLVLSSEHVQMLFKEIINRNISRVWIASDAWSTTRFLMSMPGINQVGDIFGFSFITAKIPGFEEYLRNISIKPGVRNNFINEYKQIRSNCTQQPGNTFNSACNETDDKYLLRSVDLTEAYGQRVAVYAIAHAIKKFLQCDNSSCNRNTSFPAWKLISIIRQMKFAVDNQTYFFNKDGDFENGYDLIMWKKNGDEREPQVLGKYHISSNTIEVYEQNISWFNETVPVSRCSKPCQPGTRKNILNITCCYTCVNCTAGEYSDQQDQPTCKICENGTSLPGSDRCVAWTIKYLKWSAAHSIVVLIGTIIGILLLVFSIVLLTVYRDHKPVKKNFSLLCIMQVGLLMSFVSVIVFLGYPSVQQCIAQQALYGLGFVLCVSCILAKAFDSFIAYMSYDPNRQHYLSKINKPFFNIGLLTGVQCIICILWFVLDPLSVNEIVSEMNSLTKNRLCSQGNKYIGFAIMHIYIAVLAVICFLLAFKGRKKETEPIVFSMLFHLFAWLCFIPIYVTQVEQRPIIQLSAILVSNYGVIFCHLTPKWYRILEGKSSSS